MLLGRTYRSRRRSTHTASLLVGWLAGVVVGTALGVLIAPHRGDITRRRLVRRAGEARDQVREAVDEMRETRNRKQETGEEEAES